MPRCRVSRAASEPNAKMTQLFAPSGPRPVATRPRRHAQPAAPGSDHLLPRLELPGQLVRLTLGQNQINHLPSLLRPYAGLDLGIVGIPFPTDPVSTKTRQPQIPKPTRPEAHLSWDAFLPFRFISHGTRLELVATNPLWYTYVYFPAILDTHMPDRTELLSSIARTIQDYRLGEIPQPTPDHVERWVNQFPDDVRTAILRELHDVFQRTYVPRRTVEEFLLKLATHSDIAGHDLSEFWRNTCILNIQKNGKSQAEIRTLFGQIIDAEFGLKLEQCGTGSSTRQLHNLPVRTSVRPAEHEVLEP